MTVSIVDLPGVPVAAAGGRDGVWCVAEDRLLAFEAGGARGLDAPIDSGVTSLGAAATLLAATFDPGVVAWLDPRSGAVLRRFPLGGEPRLVSGAGSVWAVDARTARAWRLGGPGTLIGPHAVPGVDRAAADGERLWWTSREDTKLRDLGREVDLGVSGDEHGGLAVCAGAVWVSVAGGLIRVGAWGADRGPLVSAPAGPVPFMVCAEGVLVGGSARRGLFVLDPSVDAEARRLDDDLGPDLAILVATRTTAWAFAGRRAEARVVTIRAG